MVLYYTSGEGGDAWRVVGAEIAHTTGREVISVYELHFYEGINGGRPHFYEGMRQ